MDAPISGKGRGGSHGGARAGEGDFKKQVLYLLPHNSQHRDQADVD